MTQYPIWLVAVYCFMHRAQHVIGQEQGADTEFRSEIPSPRQEHAVASLCDNIYIIGGISSNYSYTPDTLNVNSSAYTVDLVQSYNTQTDVWSNAASLPISMNHANAAAVGGKIFVLGGLLGANFTLWGGVPNSYSYDPLTNIWTELAPMPEGTARGACAVGVRGSEIFLAGGMRSLELGPSELQDSTALTSSYNVRTNTWRTDYPPLPGARDHVGGAVIGNKFYVTGGRDQGQRNVRGDTWALDLDRPNKGWKKLANMPTPRGGLAAAAAGHCLYTFGGEGNPNVTSGVFDNVEVYDTRTDVWEEEAPLWAGIHGTNAATNRGIIYIPGGGYQIGAGASNFTVAYQPDSHCFD